MLTPSLKAVIKKNSLTFYTLFSLYTHPISIFSSPSIQSTMSSIFPSLNRASYLIRVQFHLLKKHVVSFLFTSKENKEYVKFRKHGFKFKQELEFCFAGTYAIGAYRMTPSSGVIPSSHTSGGFENQNQEGFTQ
ncbi:uncharacterized protein LOC120007424 isoform X1 [Tripterygium wilfordii]|uniref:uncharacterized protein LOC120007424 isoform X1 n=1 Tax=Tripterygium wilfordii TaxID=458696 RepID=UPI0018F84193|nr:uncharacterized protein LOC120007424 isoform X1 [Tripterygium wilfordii]